MFSIGNILMLGAVVFLFAIIATQAPSQSTGMTVQATVIAS